MISGSLLWSTGQKGELCTYTVITLLLRDWELEPMKLELVVGKLLNALVELAELPNGTTSA